MSRKSLRNRPVRRAAQRDANHNDIVRLFLGLGCTWLELSNVAGALDGVLGCSGVDQRVEIKDGSKPPSRWALTPDEQDVFDEWRGRKPVIIKAEQEAIDLVNHIRKHQCTTGDESQKK